MNKKKTRKSKQNNNYFTKETEQAIIDYNNSSSRREKNKIYTEHIDHVFRKLIDNVIYTYKYNNLSDLSSVREDVLLYLISVMNKFDPSKGSAAFSYFTVITRNRLSHLAKKQARKQAEEIDIEEIHKPENIDKVSIEHQYDQFLEKTEFFQELVSFLEKEKETTTFDYEEQIINSIQEIITKRHKLDILHKKALFVYIKEITGLETKYISPVIKRLKQKYGWFKENWITQGKA